VLQRANGEEAMARAREMLESVGMAGRGEDYPRALSGGELQRVAIARALVHRPKLLILDEATAALDPATEAGVWEAIERVRGKTTVVAISHQPALAGVADRMYRIEDLRAVPIAPPFPRPAAALARA
jgi:ABC-type lipoprotein export system ATPase subunit